jgi:hypothetical protein
LRPVTVYEDALVEITSELARQHIRSPRRVAEAIGAKLMERRIIFQRARVSPEFLKRFHAHCRYLATALGLSYDELKQQAIDEAMKQNAWPVKIIAKKIRYRDDRGEDVEIVVDVTIPQSTTVANAKQLTIAYDYLQGVAEEAGVHLPEDRR